jgi:hypothetical protein
MRISLLVGLILVQMFVGSFSSSAFAVCEAEREAFSQACESHVTWCKASEIVGIAGTIVTAPFAWGCGGLFGAIPAVVAKLKLEQIDMRQKALDACIARHNEEVRTRNIQALVPLAEKYLEMQSQIEDEYTAKIKNFIRFFIDEGYDINESTDSFRSNADQILANLKGAETNSGRQVIYLDNIPDPSDSELPYQPKSHDNDLRNELLKLEKDLYKIGPELKFNKHKNA